MSCSSRVIRFLSRMVDSLSMYSAWSWKAMLALLQVLDALVVGHDGLAVADQLAPEHRGRDVQDVLERQEEDVEHRGAAREPRDVEGEVGRDDEPVEDHDTAHRQVQRGLEQERQQQHDGEHAPGPDDELEDDQDQGAGEVHRQERRRPGDEQGRERAGRREGEEGACLRGGTVRVVISPA